MNTNRKKILEMLSEDQITVEEAERLLAALDAKPASKDGAESKEEPPSEGVRMLAGFTYRRGREPRFKWVK